MAKRRTEADADRATDRQFDDRCHWTTGEVRCLLPAEVAGDPYRAVTLCGWHALAKQDLRHATFEAFEAWCLYLRGHFYCTWETHYPTTLLWDWLEGIGSDPFQAPTPCARTSCSVRPFDDPAWLDSRPGYRRRPCPRCGRSWVEASSRCPRAALHKPDDARKTLAIPLPQRRAEVTHHG